MNNLLPILFAVMDCQMWKHDEVVKWADQTILKIEIPEGWLLDICMSTSAADAVCAIREGLIETGSVLPDNIGDLMAGFVLLRFDKGELSNRIAKKQLVDISDAYELMGIDPELVEKIELSDIMYSRLRHNAEKALDFLCSNKQRYDEGSVNKDNRVS